MRWLIVSLVILFGLLQIKLWAPQAGYAEVWRLRAAVETQARENDGLKEQNAALTAEVKDLKDGLAAVEERARTELGMIKEDETFFQIVDKKR